MDIFIKLDKRGFEKVEEEKSDAEIILAVDDKGIIGTKKVEEKNPLVIPCIQVNKWSIETSDKTSTSKKRKIDLGEQKGKLNFKFSSLQLFFLKVRNLIHFHLNTDLIVNARFNLFLIKFVCQVHFDHLTILIWKTFFFWGVFDCA